MNFNMEEEIGRSFIL